MSNYISRARMVFGVCVLAGLLGGPSCSADAENVGELEQPLICQSVAMCDDGDPCTDDLCVANLCVNAPLLNCCLACSGGTGGAGGAGGDGAGSGTGGKAQGGKSGSFGGSAGAHPAVMEGGNGGDPGNTEVAVGGLGSGGERVIDSAGNGTSQAGQAMAPDGDAGATGQVSAAETDVWRMQGGGCTLSAGAGPPGAATPWALLAMLLAAFEARKRRQHGRADGARSS